MNIQRGMVSNELRARFKRLPLADLVHSDIALQRDGQEFRACCPFHAESTPSFTVFAGTDENWRFFCFGCGAKGDALDWLMLFRRMSRADAVAYLTSWSGGDVSAPPPLQPIRKARATDWTAVQPVPAGVPNLLQADGRTRRIYNPKRAGTDREYTTLHPAHVAAYRDAEGRLQGYVLRNEAPDGGKFTPMVTWAVPAESDGVDDPVQVGRWCLWPMREARCFYGTERLTAYPDAPVILLAGEKKADAVQKMLPDVVVLSWAGGDQGRLCTDFSPLKGRRVVVAPDNDPSGMAAALGFVDRGGKLRPGAANLAAEAGAAQVRVLRLPDAAPKGWDLGDAIAEGWNADRLRAYLRENATVPHDPLKWTDPLAAVPPAPEPPPSEEAGQRPATEPDDAIPDDDARPYVFDDEPPHHSEDHYDGGLPVSGGPVPLGFDRGRYTYLSMADGQIHELTAGQHTKMTLIGLASLPHFWERTRFVTENGKIDWTGAADWLMTQARQAGVFDPHRIRGRGAWMDEGRIVVHTGDDLVVDGAPMATTAIRSRFVYERKAPLVQVGADPLSNADAAKLVDLCCALSWEGVSDADERQPLAGYLLAGWCVCALICGAIRWRPSIWLTGPSGSGKGWVIDNIIKPALGRVALVAEGDSTDKGIEQALGGDARPVVFDEAEGEVERQRERLQQILFLVRVAASSTGGQQFKGTIDGRGRSSATRTCFAFASIAPTVKQFADENRVTMLSLIKNGDQTHFADLKRRRSELFQPGFHEALATRVFGLVPVICQNLDTFSDAATEHFGSRRIGDQIGALLAGAYALKSSKPVTPEAARAWIKDKAWNDLTAAETEPDEQRLWRRIMDYQVKVAASNSGSRDISIGELIEAARSRGDLNIPAEEADRHLMRHGLRLAQFGKGILVSNTHTVLLGRVLANTPWSAGPSRLLRRIPEAKPHGSAVRFGNAPPARCILVPFDPWGD